MPIEEYIGKGGAVMMVLVLVSIYALGVIGYKLYQFYVSGVWRRGFVDPVMQHVRKGELADAEKLLEPHNTPVSRVMKVAISCIANRKMSLKTREAEIARVGTQEVRQLEKHLRGLELVASTGPLLGLLGTVMGMVTAFARLAAAGSQIDPSLLAEGIWEALITTVGGLVIAIPALTAYYILDGVIENVRALMRDTTVQILALEDEYIRNEKEQEKHEQYEQEKAEKEARAALERAALAERATAQQSSTLRLLNPSYNKF